MYNPDEEIEEGEFEEILPPDVIKISDLQDDEIKLIEESHMDESHNHLNEELLDDKPRKPMTKREIFNAISAARKSGAISSKEKAKLLREMGVTTSDFTQKKSNKSTKIKKRKQQKSSRRTNRK